MRKSYLERLVVVFFAEVVGLVFVLLFDDVRGADVEVRGAFLTVVRTAR